MDKKKVLLSDLYATIMDWYQNQDNIDKKKQLGILKQQIDVAEYLPLMQKQEVLEEINAWLGTKGETLGEVVAIQEYALIMFGLLRYSNIENDIDKLQIDYQIYDALMFGGIVDDILQVCRSDFERLQDMMNQMLNTQILMLTLETTQNLDLDKAGEAAEEISKIFNNLGEKTIGDLAAIAQANDPGVALLKNMAEIQAATEVKQNT